MNFLKNHQNQLLPLAFLEKKTENQICFQFQIFLITLITNYQNSSHTTTFQFPVANPPDPKHSSQDDKRGRGEEACGRDAEGSERPSRVDN